MSIDEPKFVGFAKALFKKCGSDYEKIVNKFQEVFEKNASERDRLPHYAHFYYFICKPDSVSIEDDKIREELQIVGLTSLIEAMMIDLDYEYKGFFDFFEEKFPGKNSIENYEETKKEYLSLHGIARRVRNYFNKYMSEGEIFDIIDNIKIWDDEKKEMIPMEKDVGKLANFLYDMRSDFVHKAEMRCLCPIDVDAAFITVGKKYYDLNRNVNIYKIFEIFGKSFVKYWEEKYKKLFEK